jgi:glycosyltransferase involved in cell wall biosynthesis
MKVTIITATYNSSGTIKDTLESVANQTYKDIEHIIIDGLSSDETLEIIKEYPHVARVFSEKDKGIYDAMNKGISLATGDIIGILNSDDIFASDDILENIESIFGKNDSIDAVYGNISYFRTEEPDKIVRYWKSKPYYETFFDDGNVPPHPSLFVRKKVYDEIGTYYPKFKICSDYEFMLKMFKIYNYKSYFIDTTFVRMRMGGTSTQGLKSYLITTKELKEAWNKNNLQYPFKLYFIRPLKKILQLIKK